MADVKVSIEGGAITVDKDKVQALAGSEKVKWTGSVQFGIRMPSGYEAPVITQQGNKWAGEGGPYDKINGQKIIKYDVTSPGYPDLDPEIELMP